MHGCVGWRHGAQCFEQRGSLLPQFREGAEQRAAYRLAVPSGRAGQHRVAAIETAALQPDRLPVAVDPVKEVKTTLFKLLAGSSAAEAEDVPANEPKNLS